MGHFLPVQSQRPCVQAFAVSKQLCDSIKQEQSIVMNFLRKVGPCMA